MWRVQAGIPYSGAESHEMRRASSLLTSVAVLAGLAAPIVLTMSAPAAATPTCETITVGSPDVTACALTGSQASVGAPAFEPTIGATTTGELYFSTNPGSGVAVGFGAGISKSTDGGATWTDVSPTLAGRRIPVETNDPYIYVDPGTNRVFTFHMEPILLCASVSYSDDKGATWSTNPVGCGPTGPWDHQTMVASKPRTVPTSGYANVLTQCVNAIYAEMCSRSLDGGRTWSPSTPVNVNSKVTQLCGTQTGHLAAAPDGTIFLPTSECGDRPIVYTSTDDGLTWTRRIIANIDIPFDDPTITVDAAGNVYAAFVDEVGQLWLSVSKNGGVAWGPAMKVTSPSVTAVKPAITVGDAGRIAIAFPGTAGIPGQFPGLGGMSDAAKKAVRWGGWFTTSTNALDATPTFTTIEATGTDALIRGAGGCAKGGRCTYIVDFIGATLRADGIPFASFVDGCTSNTCKTNQSASNNEPGTTAPAVAVSVPIDLCELTCARLPSS